jgi:hypothetical protein
MLRNFMQSRFWLGVAVFASLTCLPAAFGQGSLDPISVVKYTLDTAVANQPIVNECNGENVLMNGTMHFEYFFLTDADSDFTVFQTSSTSRLPGIGQTTGANYVTRDSTSSTDRTSEQASDTTTTLKSRLVAQGPTPDMLLRQILHVVVDKKGNIKAEVVKNTVTCK